MPKYSLVAVLWVVGLVACTDATSPTAPTQLGPSQLDHLVKPSTPALSSPLSSAKPNSFGSSAQQASSSGSNSGTPGSPSLSVSVGPYSEGNLVQATFSWTTPSSNGSPITGYNLQTRKEKSNGSWGGWGNYSRGVTNSMTIGYEPNGAYYQARVRAINANGAGSWSNTVTYDIPDTPDDVDGDDCDNIDPDYPSEPCDTF